MHKRIFYKLLDLVSVMRHGIGIQASLDCEVGNKVGCKQERVISKNLD